jgi:hypothetical protein
MTVDDGTSRTHETRHCCGELLERGVNGRVSGVGNGVGAHDTGLKLGDFGNRRVDAVLDRADLGCDFECGVLNLMLAHDCSFPRDQNRADMVAGN